MKERWTWLPVALCYLIISFGLCTHTHLLQVVFVMVRFTGSKQYVEDGALARCDKYCCKMETERPARTRCLPWVESTVWVRTTPVQICVLCYTSDPRTLRAFWAQLVFIPTFQSSNECVYNTLVSNKRCVSQKVFNRGI